MQSRAISFFVFLIDLFLIYFVFELSPYDVSVGHLVAASSRACIKGLREKSFQGYESDIVSLCQGLCRKLDEDQKKVFTNIWLHYNRATTN